MIYSETVVTINEIYQPRSSNSSHRASGLKAMDRQTLLEEKRKRLAQLRQRRYDTSGDLVEQLLQKHLQSPPIVGKKIDVAVQVDFIEFEHQQTHEKQELLIPEKQCNTFDKGIQAVPFEEHPEHQEQEQQQQQQSEQQDDGEQQYKKKLNGHAKEAMETGDLQRTMCLNKVDIHKEVSKFDEYICNRKEFSMKLTGSSAFDTIAEINEIDRKVTSIIFSQHYPELVIVSYSSNTNGSFSKSLTHNSPGLCIIYSVGDNIIPQFYLTCPSPITAIMFDKIDLFKIIGGMSDGRLCIWNLKEYTTGSLELSPMLTSPMISSVFKSPFDVQQHVLPIVGLFQSTSDGSNSIISVSLDGIINVWSTNLLALPKQDSIKLIDSNIQDITRFRETIRVSKAVEIFPETVFMTNVSYEPNHFLKNLVIATEAGTIVKLSNDKAKNYIEFIESVEKDTIVTSGVITPKLLLEKYLITSNYNWFIRLWDISTKSYIINIPTTSLVFLIAVRCKYQFQFVTVGVNSSTNTSVIDYWDLNKKLFSPLCSIPLKNDEIATSIDFDPSGGSILVGFENGSLMHIGVDTQLLNEQINEQNITTEDGIERYLSAL